MNFAGWLHRAVRLAWFWVTIWVVLVVAAACVISVMYWDWLSIRESNGSTIRNIVLAAAAVIALPLAIWRSTVAERQAKTAQRQANTAQQGLLHERYQKGAEMLGSALLSVRLGGIYALQRLAEEHPGGYHTQIMRLLCAFVRNPPGSKEGQAARDAKEKAASAPPSLREDVQAVMTVIGNRSQADVDYENAIKNFRLDLYGADLAGAQLHTLNLCGANLRGACLTFATLSQADLSRADLMGANLDRADVKYANLSRASLQRARLSHMRGALADFSCTNLNGADLSEARLECVNLSDANVAAANFYRVLLRDANLSHIRASGANFSCADLIGANLSHARLGRANLSDANVAAVNLSHAELGYTNLSGTVFEKITVRTESVDQHPTEEDFFPRLTQTQLDEAQADPDNPPRIGRDVVDAETGKPLVWYGKSLEKER